MEYLLQLKDKGGWDSGLLKLIVREQDKEKAIEVISEAWDGKDIDEFEEWMTSKFPEYPVERVFIEEEIYP